MINCCGSLDICFVFEILDESGVVSGWLEGSEGGKGDGVMEEGSA